MNRRAMGFTAAPEYPEMVFLPETSPPMVTDFMVLIAEIASAPPWKAAVATRFMVATFGVIFAMTGMPTAALTSIV